MTTRDEVERQRREAEEAFRRQAEKQAKDLIDPNRNR